METYDSNKAYDVFISHASEDKEEIATPLAYALKSLDLEVWYDEFTLKIGDRLREQIDLGLSRSTYGIVILSKSFLKKPWTNLELEGLIAKTTSSGKKMILPIWHQISRQDLENFSLILANIKALNTNEGIIQIARKIAEEIKGKPHIIKHKEVLDFYLSEDLTLLDPLTYIDWRTLFKGFMNDPSILVTTNKRIYFYIDFTIKYPLPKKVYFPSLRILKEKSEKEEITTDEVLNTVYNQQWHQRGLQISKEDIILIDLKKPGKGMLGYGHIKIKMEYNKVFQILIRDNSSLDYIKIKNMLIKFLPTTKLTITE